MIDLAEVITVIPTGSHPPPDPAVVMEVKRAPLPHPIRSLGSGPSRTWLGVVAVERAGPVTTPTIPITHTVEVIIVSITHIIPTTTATSHPITTTIIIVYLAQPLVHSAVAHIPSPFTGVSIPSRHIIPQSTILTIRNTRTWVFFYIL